jgi:hypothetical protein
MRQRGMDPSSLLEVGEGEGVAPESPHEHKAMFEMPGSLDTTKPPPELMHSKSPKPPPEQYQKVVGRKDMRPGPNLKEEKAEWSDMEHSDFKPKGLTEKSQKRLLRAELIDIRKQQKLIHSGQRPSSYKNVNLGCEKQVLGEIDMYYPGQEERERKLMDGPLEHEEMKHEINYRDTQLEWVKSECMPVGMSNPSLTKSKMSSNFPIPYPAHYDSKAHHESMTHEADKLDKP